MMLNMKELIYTRDMKLLVVLVGAAGSQVVLPAYQVMEDFKDMVDKSDMCFLRELIDFEMAG